MRKIPIIVLSALLAAAIVSLVILYREYGKTRGALVAGEQKLVSLESKVAELRKEQDVLKDHARKSEEYLQMLEKAKQRISELKKAQDVNKETIARLEEQLRQAEEKSKAKEQTLLSLKEQLLAKESALRELQACSGLKEKIEEMERRCKEKEEAILRLKKDLSAKDAFVAQLKADLADATSQLASLKERLTKDKKERDALIAKLQSELAKTSSRAASLEKQVAREKEQKDELIAKFQAELQKAKAELLTLREDLAKKEKDLRTLNMRLLELKGQRAQLESQINQMKAAYDAILSDLKTQIQNKEVTISKLEQKLSITFVDRILFPFGKATITPEGKKVLAKVGSILKNVKRKQIRVIGHTDNRPILPQYRYKFPSNWELSAARAAAVVRFFQEEVGLDPRNMEAVGRSFYEPVGSNETEEGRAQNRRVNIVIGPKIE